MEETTTPSNPELTVTTSPKKTSRTAKLTLAIVVAVVVLAAVVGGTYFWRQGKINDLNGQVSNLSSANALLAKQKQQLQEQSSSQSSKTSSGTSTAPLTQTDTLDTGVTVSYPLTNANANIIWWAQDFENPAALKAAPNGTMVLSDKRILQVLSLMPSDTLTSICGQSVQFSDYTSIQLNIFNPKTKALSNNQYTNCITQVAQSKSSFAAQAKTALDQSNADIQAFVGSVTYTAP